MVFDDVDAIKAIFTNMYVHDWFLVCWLYSHKLKPKYPRDSTSSLPQMVHIASSWVPQIKTKGNLLINHLSPYTKTSIW